MSTTLVAIRNLSKRFARKGAEDVVAIDDVDLDVHKGEFTVLIGPSGCGKTTLLRCIAGLEDPDHGSIQIGQQIVYDSATNVFLPPEKRPISMVFQSYALWPHMTAFDNVRYPLTTGRNRVPKSEQRDRVRQALTTVGIPELLDRYPKQMSGGQQQRVALARALIMNTDLILFDEPLSNVDAKVREQLRIELLAMQDRLGFAAIFVTHDQTEAMVLGDTIAVLGGGRIAQLGSPREVYARPANRYVARFIGTANSVPVGGGAPVDGSTLIGFDSPVGRILAPADQVTSTGPDAVAVWRPEHATVSTSPPASAVNSYQGTVDARLYLGSHEEIIVLVGDIQLAVWTTHPVDVDKGADVWISVPPEHVRVFDA